ncbi:MAG: hypothetical protein PVG14_17705 [Anaerolineales bacterium]
MRIELKRKRVYVLVFLLALFLTLFPIAYVYAEGYDLTPPGSSVTVNGAIFEVFDPDDPTGSGLFNHFVRISSSLEVIRGYNTDYRPLQFQENNSGTFTKSALLSEVPQILIGPTLYREFQLDVNQNTPIPDRFETLDTVELWESPYPDLCGYPFDGSGGGHSGCTTNNTATIIYDMDAGENNFIVLDYTNNEGSGKRDLKLFVPDSFFSQDPGCVYQGVGCTVQIHIFSKFGEDFDGNNTNPALWVAYPNNDGYEEWGVRGDNPTATITPTITNSPTNTPTGSPSPTNTPTQTYTATPTITSTSTNTPTGSPSPAITITPTSMPDFDHMVFLPVVMRNTNLPVQPHQEFNSTFTIEDIIRFIVHYSNIILNLITGVN